MQDYAVSDGGFMVMRTAGFKLLTSGINATLLTRATKISVA